jgi:hypothetical protein
MSPESPTLGVRISGKLDDALAGSQKYPDKSRLRDLAWPGIDLAN